MSKQKPALEKVFEYLINNEEDAARDLLHEFVVAKAREIHQELVNEENLEDIEETEEVAEEEMFDEEDEIDESDGKMSAPGYPYSKRKAKVEEDDEEEMADDAEMLDVDDAEEELEGDMDMDMEVDDEAIEGDDVEAAVFDIQDAVQELNAKFDEIMGDMDGEMDAEMDAEEPMDDEAEMEGDYEEGDYEEEDMEMAESVKVSEEELDEEFEDLDEAFGLRDVGMDWPNASTGQEAGKGSFAKPDVSTKSPIATKGGATPSARPVKTGQGPEHKGFEREAEPSSQWGEGGRRDMGHDNTGDSHKKFQKDPAGGAALMNKSSSDGFSAPNTKSVISGKKKK